MIIITDKNGKEFIHHCGESTLGKNLPICSEVDFIQADGDELYYIVRLFTVNNQITIPVSLNNSNLWFGDIAKQIWSQF